MSHTEIAARPSVMDRIGQALAGIRDWLDERGKAAWIAAMILSHRRLAAGPRHSWLYDLEQTHVFLPPPPRFPQLPQRRLRADRQLAFDAYRAETLKRLEDEHTEFPSCRNCARPGTRPEFDQFMQARKEPRRDPARLTE